MPLCYSYVVEFKINQAAMQWILLPKAVPSLEIKVDPYEYHRQAAHKNRYVT